MKKGDLVWATRVWSGKTGTVGIWKEVEPLLAVICDVDVSLEYEEDELGYRLLIDGKKSDAIYCESDLELVENA